MLSLFRGSFILDSMYFLVVVTFSSLSSSLVVAKITGGGVNVFDSSFPSLLLLSLVVVLLLLLWSSSSSGSLLWGSVMSTTPSLLTLLLLDVLVVSILVVLVVSLFVESLLVVSVLREVDEEFVVWEDVEVGDGVVELCRVAESADLRSVDRLRTVSFGEDGEDGDDGKEIEVEDVEDVEVEDEDVVGGSVSRIEESVFVQSDNVIEHPGDSGAVELSCVCEQLFFNLDPQSLHTRLPSTKAT